MATQNTQVATLPAGKLISRMAGRFGVDQNKLVTTLKCTAFRVKDGEPTNEQMMALMVVADQYGLNPFTKEIYAFPDKQNGIVPVVGVDGWSRIINEQPNFDGLEFEQDDEKCTCIIFRKDRAHPIKVTEYASECRRNTGPWQTHPKRMLRHKALIQCARLAFGFAGIYDADEAEVIREARDMGEAMVVSGEPEQGSVRPTYSQEEFTSKFEVWVQPIREGKKTADQVIAMLESKAALTDGMKQSIRSIKQKAAAPVENAVSAPNAEALRAMMDEAGWREKDLADQVGADDIDSMSAEQRAQAAELLESAE